MKAILVIDIPNEVDISKLSANVEINKIKDCGYDYEPYTFQLYCSLRPMPKKIPFDEAFKMEDYSRGYNACIDEITGETE